MKIRKILFFTLTIILCVGMLNSCIGEDNSNSHLNFTCNGINYSIDVEKIAKEKNVNIEDYPYYMIAKESSSISIYYSKQRVVAKRYSWDLGCHYIYGSDSSLRIDIDKDGSITGKIVDFSLNYYIIYSNGFIASNHDIFYDNKIIYNKNHGYEYDPSQESEKTCNDIMRVTTETKVYEKAGVNYNEIVTLTSGDIVKRIAYSVVTVYGHAWDKIILNDGTEGYIFADSLETQTETEYENINFEYNNKTYDIYFSPSRYGVNIEDYPYYMIVNETSAISIYYSKQRIIAKRYSSDLWCHYVYGSDSSLRIDINKDGSTTGKIVDFSLNYYIIYSDGFIASNHDIFYDNKIIYNKNHGYEYDSSQEGEKTCNDIMRVTTETKVYEKAGVNYNEIAKLTSGDTVKRIAYSVVTVYGHTWDKIVLNDGTEGYIFADSLEIQTETEYENINFEYNDKTYDIYFSPSRYGVNIEDYSYYMIVNETSAISIYYSKQRIVANRYSSDLWCYYVYGSDSSLRIDINKDGSITGKIVDFSLNYYIIYSDGFIASNHDIFYDNKIIYNKNHGYEYDPSQESEKTCNDIMRVTTETKVYEKAGVNYNEIATLASGDTVTRIAYSVANAYGYTWDKITLKNGTEGYIPTNYLECPSYNEYEVDGKKFIENQTYSKHDSKYNIEKSIEDKNWNTMEESERRKKSDKMDSTYNRLRRAAKDYENKFELASQSLNYYLDCKGGVQKLSDIRTLFADIKQAEFEYKYLNYNMDAAEYFTTTTTTSSFALEEEYDLVVGSYSTIADEFLAAMAGDMLYEIRVDWFLAAHEFKMGNYATVEKFDNTYKMYVDFNMCDYYDWDDDNNIIPIDSDILNPIKEKNIRDLHYAGEAKNYENRGTIRVYVEWQAGQNAEQAIVKILS